MTLPLGARLSELFTLKSWLRIAPWPLPLWSVEKMAGLVGATCTGRGSEGVAHPSRLTVMLEVELPATSYGTVALICVAETKMSGAATLPNRSALPPSEEPTWPLAGVNRTPSEGAFISAPKTDTISPGETRISRKLAPLVIARRTGWHGSFTIWNVFWPECQSSLRPAKPGTSGWGSVGFVAANRTLKISGNVVDI